MKRWWNEDVYRRWLLVGGFVFAWIFSQGIPLWDDDFTSWFWKIKDHGIFYYILAILSPISSQTSNWAFNERPIEALIYKVFYLVSGYEPWSYFLYKSAVYAGLGVMIYQWGLRLVPKTSFGKKSAVAAAVFFLVCPGPIAAHILHQDLAPTAELIFLLLTYFMWGEIEKTPHAWSGTPDFKNPEHKKWIVRWSVLAFLTYIGYKSKADLKLIPFIVFGYTLLVRRHQWRFFAIPFALMLLLAVPWGPGIFTKLPPFMPGSRGSEIGWMWQPASLERAFEFIWASGQFDFMASLRASTISLAGLLGPFMLVGMLAFLGWKMEAIDKVNWTSQESTVDRSRTFVLIWCAAILVGVSALPAINYIFRIRYGILHLVPVSILLAWVFGLFAESTHKLPKWATVGAMALAVIQGGINLNRSIVYRRDMGQVMVAVDQVYGYLNDRHGGGKFNGEKLALLPDFRPYDYRPDAGDLFLKKEWLSNADELVKKNYPQFKTYVISWKPSLWDNLEVVEHFTGCRDANLFDKLNGCAPGSGVFLMRYIGTDPLYTEGETLRQRGDIAGARKLHEQYLAKYPKSMAGHFVLGLEAFQQKDWERARLAYANLERYFPDHLSILYNHALALVELKEFDHAIARLRFITDREPNNYAALINLYWTYVKAGKEKKARTLLADMKAKFPNDREVNRLVAGS